MRLATTFLLVGRKPKVPRSLLQSKPILGGSWVVTSGVLSRETILLTGYSLSRVLITLLPRASREGTGAALVLSAIYIYIYIYIYIFIFIFIFIYIYLFIYIYIYIYMYIYIFIYLFLFIFILIFCEGLGFRVEGLGHGEKGQQSSPL